MPEYRRNTMLGCKPVKTVSLKAPASLINASTNKIVFFFYNTLTSAPGPLLAQGEGVCVGFKFSPGGGYPAEARKNKIIFFILSCAPLSKGCASARNYYLLLNFVRFSEIYKIYLVRH